MRVSENDFNFKKFLPVWNIKPFKLLSVIKQLKTFRIQKQKFD